MSFIDPGSIILHGEILMMLLNTLSDHWRSFRSCIHNRHVLLRFHQGVLDDDDVGKENNEPSNESCDVICDLSLINESFHELLTPFHLKPEYD